MSRTIRHTTTLSAADRAAVFGSGSDPFGVAHLGLQWRPKDSHFLLDVAGAPIAHVGVVRHDVLSEQSSIRLAGFGAVITALNSRGQGHATALVQHVIGEVVEWGAEAALLFCLPGLVPFYRRLGFEVVTTQVLVEQPTGQIVAPFPGMVRSLTDRIWPERAVTLGSLPW